MAARSGGSSSPSKPSKTLPIFVFPQRIDFLADTPSQHKQVFTLHNPYDFPVKFKLLTSQRYRYRVMQREGVIKEKHCTDIIVRLQDQVHQQISDENLEQRSLSRGHRYFSLDKLRFEVYDQATDRPLGQRDVQCFIWRTKQDFVDHSGLNLQGASALPQLENSIDSDDDSMVTSFNGSSMQTSVFGAHQTRVKTVRGNSIERSVGHLDTRYRGSVWVPAIAIAICLVVLSLPREILDSGDGEDGGFVQSKLLRPSENQRLIAAYVLGILTMIIVQYQQ